MSMLPDNINSTDNHVVDELTNDPTGDHVDVQEVSDEYLKIFDEIESKNSNLKLLIDSLPIQPHDQSRLYILLNVVKEQQKLNEKMYDLMVEMNNYFGAK